MGKGPEVVNKLGTSVLRGSQDKLINNFVVLFCSAIPNLEIDAWESYEIKRNRLSERQLMTLFFSFITLPRVSRHATGDNGLIGSFEIWVEPSAELKRE